VSVQPPATAVLGAGLACALGHGLEACTDALLEGRRSVDHITLDTLDPPLNLPCHRIPGGPSSPTERLYALLDEVVQTALEAAGLRDAERGRMGILLGSTSMDISVSEGLYAQALDRDEDAMPLALSGYGNLATRVAERFGIHGPDFSFNTACSSAANALLYAQRLIEGGVLDHVLVLGVEMLNRLSLAGFHSLMLYAPDAARPFDVSRNGLVLGEALSAAVIGRGDGVWPGLRLRGGATGCDTTSSTNATPGHIAAIMRETLADVGCDPSAVAGIKAHGTSTPSNDLAEGQGMRELFGREVPPFTSLKPQLGHTLGACGLVETLLFMACVARGSLPATRGFAEVDPEIALAPLNTVQHAPVGVYLLNYFGFGGNNCSLVVERTA
jgi:3-oxoacyl-[acyl-carrier-protein] synthase-1